MSRSIQDALLQVLNEEEDKAEVTIPAKNAKSENNEEDKDVKDADKVDKDIADRTAGSDELDDDKDDEEDKKMKEKSVSDFAESTKKKLKEDRIDDIMKFEDGTLSDEESKKLIQSMIDDDSVWKLQGFYGRTAAAGLKNGTFKATTDTAKRVAGRMNEDIENSLNDDDDDDATNADGLPVDDNDDLKIAEGKHSGLWGEDFDFNDEDEDDEDDEDKNSPPKEDIGEEAIPDGRGKGYSAADENKRIRANGKYDDADNARHNEDDDEEKFDKVKSETEGVGGNVDPEATAENDRIKRNYRDNSRSAADRPPGYDVKVTEGHLKALFGDNETLTEEFKTRASTVFEAAVKENVKAQSKVLKEHYTKVYSRKLREQFDGLVDKLDGYLGIVAETWMKQNEIALESGMRSQITENFVRNMKNVFEQNYIELPEEKVDLVRSLKAKTRNINTKLNETTEQLVAARKEIAGLHRKQILGEASVGLSQAQAEKLGSLVEGLDFTDATEFKKKVGILKESYFQRPANKRASAPVDPVSSVQEAELISEDVRAIANTITKMNTR